MLLTFYDFIPAKDNSILSAFSKSSLLSGSSININELKKGERGELGQKLIRHKINKVDFNL